jgi:pilus assembly protein CpaB
MASAYLDRREKEVSFMADPVDVVVSARDLRRGDNITRDDVEVLKIPRRYAGPSHLIDADKAKGMTLIVDAPKGSQIKRHHLAAVGHGAGVAAMVPKGLRAVSVRLDPSVYESATVATGDFVDVIATIDVADVVGVKTAAITIAENVMVMAVDGEYLGAPLLKTSGSPRGLAALVGSDSAFGRSSTITFLLTPKAAQDVIFARRYGEVSVAIRGREETNLPASPEPTTVLSVAGRHEGFVPLRKEFREYRGKSR